MFEQFIEWLQNFLKFLSYSPFKLGDVPINIALAIKIVVVIIAAYVISKLLKKILQVKLFPKLKLDDKTKSEVLKSINYIIIVTAVYVTPRVAGIEAKWLALVVKITIIMVAAITISKLVQVLIGKQLSRKTDLDEGTQYNILKFIQYLVIAGAIYESLRWTGLDLTELAFLVGGVSVGVGFGLQTIASNFISGIIMLFERPVKKGDLITVSDYDGKIFDISMRATVVSTLDNISIIVPNSRFINEDVTNWSHHDPKVRLHVPVGVAYGSDVQLVTKLLLKVADDHPQAIDDPSPKVWFTEFGDSSLNFELLVWISNPFVRKQVLSDLNYAIDAIFRENNITIPFPQRDLHLQSLPPAEE